MLNNARGVPEGACFIHAYLLGEGREARAFSSLEYTLHTEVAGVPHPASHIPPACMVTGRAFFQYMGALCVTRLTIHHQGLFRGGGGFPGSARGPGGACRSSDLALAATGLGALCGPSNKVFAEFTRPMTHHQPYHSLTQATQDEERTRLVTVQSMLACQHACPTLHACHSSPSAVLTCTLRVGVSRAQATQDEERTRLETVQSTGPDGDGSVRRMSGGAKAEKAHSGDISHMIKNMFHMVRGLLGGMPSCRHAHGKGDALRGDRGHVSARTQKEGTVERRYEGGGGLHSVHSGKANTCSVHMHSAND
jgi:hypothetical protein